MIPLYVAPPPVVEEPCLSGPYPARVAQGLSDSEPVMQRSTQQPSERADGFSAAQSVQPSQLWRLAVGDHFLTMMQPSGKRLES